MRRFFGIGGGGNKATVTLTDNSVDTTNLTAYTFSSQSLGTAAVDRRIIIGVAGSGANAGAVSTLTVGGVSATNIIALENVDTETEIWIADVPTETTGDVVVTFAAVKARCGIGVYRAIGSRSGAIATSSSTADPMSASLLIPYDGIAVGVGMDQSTSTYTWTNLTERYDETVEGTISHTGSSLNSDITQTLTITCNPSSAASQQAMVLASWEPN